jgi:hypothetical protein
MSLRGHSDMTTNDEAEAAKRHELQLLLLREGYSQDEARMMAANLAADKLDEWVEKRRPYVMNSPERQILPPGAIDLHDLKSQREDALMEAEEAKYMENVTKLGIMMAQSFSLPELPDAVLRALRGVLEINGLTSVDAAAKIFNAAEIMRNYEVTRAKVEAK